MLSQKINIIVSDRFYQSKMYRILHQEQVEIDKLKWIESEKAGRDIGRYRAVFLWKKHYRDKWLIEFRDSI